MIAAITQKLRTLGRLVRADGLGHTMRFVVGRGAVQLLAWRYGFPASWHNPTSARPYRITVAKMINALQPDIVCEVGCGLGSILKRVRAGVRIGYDCDPGVVAAARLLRSSDIEFRRGSLSDVDLSRIDVLVMVNWIHEISALELAKGVVPLLDRTTHLVVDAIDPGSDGYTYYHDFAFLNGRAEVTQSLRVPGEGRTFQTWRIIS